MSLAIFQKKYLVQYHDAFLSSALRQFRMKALVEVIPTLCNGSSIQFLKVIASMAVAVLSFWIILSRRKSTHHYFIQEKSANDLFKPCPNPQCVRCRRYQQVNAKARQRLAALRLGGENNLSQRVVQAVQQGPLPKQSDTTPAKGVTLSPVEGQYPSVLLVPGLLARPIVSEFHIPAIDHLQRHQREILDEYQKALTTLEYQHRDIGWSQNDVPQGEWRAFHLLNQGHWNADAVQLCPQTTHLVRQLGPNLMCNGCVFGNAFFSVVQEGTTIEPHCGPCNVRHRLHLTLLAGILSKEDESYSAPHANNETGIPTNNPLLHVANQTISWSDGQAFVFDDSLVHSVDYSRRSKTNDVSKVRVVLIVDLWHPDLNSEERELINDLYRG